MFNLWCLRFLNWDFFSLEMSFEDKEMLERIHNCFLLKVDLWSPRIRHGGDRRRMRGSHVSCRRLRDCVECTMATLMSLSPFSATTASNWIFSTMTKIWTSTMVSLSVLAHMIPSQTLIGSSSLLASLFEEEGSWHLFLRPGKFWFGSDHIGFFMVVKCVPFNNCGSLLASKVISFCTCWFLLPLNSS